MKIAVSGKGGVGKTTITAALSILLAERGTGKVLAIDADPDSNLASALGMTDEEQKSLVPIVRQKELIEERTGASLDGYGRIFRLNPEVSDIADRYARPVRGVHLLVIGGVRRGGGGCACPENTMVQALINEAVLHRDETILLDMEAGIEHLGRATTRGMDMLLVVVEPGKRSVDSALRIRELAGHIGLKNLKLVMNRVRSAEDEEFLRANLPGFPVLGVVPFSENILSGDRDGLSVVDCFDDGMKSLFLDMIERLG